MAIISLTRALTEIKNLDSQINTQINSNKFCVTTKGLGNKMTVVGTNITPLEAENRIKSDYQKVSSLISRRQRLKAAVQRSNAVTMVNIGGVDMLVADAIERKNSIGYETSLFQTMKNQYGTAINSMERGNAILDEQIEKAVQQAYSNERGKVTPEQYDAVAEPRKAEHQLTVLDPLKLSSLLEEQVEKLNAFLMEVDFVLSESNARNTVDVD